MKRTALFQNYPNPFNPDTWIPYHLENDSEVIIRIYNHSGKLMRVLLLGKKNAGTYISKSEAAYWDGKDNSGEEVASGVYFYTMQADDFTDTRKMVMIR